MIIIGLVISNGLVSLGGALIAQNQNFQILDGDRLHGHRPGIGYHWGGALWEEEFFMRLTSLVFGAITYRIIIAFVLKLGMHSNDLKLLYCNNGSHCPVPAYDQGFVNPPKIAIGEVSRMLRIDGV